MRHARWRLGREACLCTFTPSTSSSFCCSSCFSTRSCTRATELLALDLCAAVPSKEQAQACPQCAHKRASTASKCGDLHGCGTHAQSQEADMCGQTPAAHACDRLTQGSHGRTVRTSPSVLTCMHYPHGQSLGILCFALVLQHAGCQQCSAALPACMPPDHTALHDTGTIKQPEPLLMQSVTARLDVFLV